MKKLRSGQRLYAVCAVSSTRAVNIQGFPSSLDMTWADGMVGVIPVFTNKKKARKYAGKDIEIITIVVGEEVKGSTNEKVT